MPLAPLANRAGSPAALMRCLVEDLSISATTDGGLRIEAPPESAAALASLFEGLASALRQGTLRA